MNKNIDDKVVKDFGLEWSSFNQRQLSDGELAHLFNRYFSILPLDLLSDRSTGFDMGCGSGRWARIIAPKVKTLHCIDPSVTALNIARENLADYENCRFHIASVDSIPLAEDSMDFGYCLGVLHHVPDTESAIKSCADKLKPGAPLLIYLYYAFDNRPAWFRVLWKVSDYLRRLVCRLPFKLKSITCSIIALFVYLPLSRLALLAEKLGIEVGNFPLAEYRTSSFYTMRTDSLDRFGTRLEKRFTRDQISGMLQRSGIENIKFSEHAPYWCVTGHKKPSD